MARLDHIELESSTTRTANAAKFQHLDQGKSESKSRNMVGRTALLERIWLELGTRPYVLEFEFLTTVAPCNNCTLS